MSPPVAKGLRKPSATTNPRAVTFSMEQNKDRDNDKSQQHTPYHPNLMRIVEKGIKKQRPGVDHAIAAPSLFRKDGIVSKSLPHPLKLNRILEEKLWNKK